ncbi:MAG: TM0106 family RecB-like putative nuclease, partial [Chloroflexota bacterium]
MQLAPDGTVIVSATDLVGYLACDHLATLELGRVEGLWERPPRRADLTVQLMQDRGDEHERAHLDHLRDQGRSVVEIDQEGLTTPERLRAAEAATLTAMRSGADVVYQATFFDGRWRGHADFLYRVERPSPVLGEWSYDIADTKLSRGVKAAAIIQMCVYAELLERVQGCPPETVYVVTGDGVEHAHRLDDYQAYYQHAKARFEERVLGGSGALPTYPDPVAHCQVCVWYPTCIQRRRDDDHPSIVAGMRRVDTERFQEAGIPTLAAIAALPQDAEVADVDARRLDRLHRQARLQLHERETGERVFELMPPLPDEPGRGLAALPERSEWDVFLDIEADPWALDGGLEYLLGLALPAGDPTARPEYRALWGHDRVGEKAAFEALIDLVVDRLESHPEMHVYHYGGYESGALKRLMQRYATREAEVDRLLRGGILVDLLNVVRQGLRASVESYSLKQIEKFYMPVREGPVTEAGFSVVEYERWMREGDPSILQAIADYNRDDCVSTLLLRDWLEERRSDATVEYPEADWSRPQPRDGSPTLQQTERQAAVTRRVEALTAGIPVDPAARSGEQQARWLLAQLLDWHWRDEKPAWWLWHDLRQTSVEDLIHRSEGIGGLEFVGDVGVDHRSTIRRYRYPPQDHKFAVGDEPIDPDHGGDFGEGVGRVAAIDDVHGLIDIVRGPTRLAYHPTRLIPGTPRGSGPMPEALLRVADSVLASGIEGPGRYRAARDLLLRLPPRVVGTPEYAPLKLSTETTLDAARRLGAALDETVLPIQGPPGTGKTYTGARMIVELVRMGRRVGVSAQSHKAITNLLREICRAAEGAGTPIRVIQKCDNGDEVEDVPSVRVVTDNKPMPEALENGEVDVVAGTAWL